MNKTPNIRPETSQTPHVAVVPHGMYYAQFLRPVGALFFLGLGYALLSFCLFRALSFQPFFIPAFFIFYIGLGFPVGGYLTARFISNHITALRWLIATLPITAVIILLMGLGSSRLTDSLPALLPLSDHDGIKIIYVLCVTPIICFPFFVLWGATEFISFQLALNLPRLKRFFYVITIAALLTAYLLGHWSLPCCGLLFTLALVAAIALAAFLCLGVDKKKSALLFLCISIVFWLMAPKFEATYITKLLPQTTRKILEGTHHPQTLQPLKRPAETALLHSSWGKYCHITLIHWQHPTQTPRNIILCCYDGMPIWGASPDDAYDPHPFSRIAFDDMPPNANVCVIGAGGGTQVAQAITKNARKVVAVDVVPEIFSLLKNEFSWINTDIYNHPRVRTIAMDGLSYIQNSGRQFDRIVLAATESSGKLLVSLFEPGQRLHSLESFQILSQHLKKDGEIIICRTVDANQRLFHAYAATLQAAGLTVSGFSTPSAGLESFMLFASKNPTPRQWGQPVRDYIQHTSSRVIDSHHQYPQAEVITENSPWMSGLLGNFLPASAANVYIQAILGIFFLVLVIVTAWARGTKNIHPAETRRGRTIYAAAGILVGVNAIFLESGIIFWCIMHLMNPLAAFFVGSAIFLLMWGISNLKAATWKPLSILGLIGILGLLLAPRWNGNPYLAGLLLTAIGSGFCFSRLVLINPSRLLNLFVFDAAGSIIGAFLGIGIPFFYGFKAFFGLLPWVAAATLAITALANINAPVTKKFER